MKRCWLACCLLPAFLASCQEEQNPAQHSYKNSRLREVALQSRHQSNADAQIASGQAIYEFHCKICHGDKGDGKGFNAFNVKAAFGVGPRNFTAADFFTKTKDRRLKKIIASGGPSADLSPAMPPWGNTLSEAEITATIAFIKTFRPAASP